MRNSGEGERNGNGAILGEFTRRTLSDIFPLAAFLFFLPSSFDSAIVEEETATWRTEASGRPLMRQEGGRLGLWFNRLTEQRYTTNPRYLIEYYINYTPHPAIPAGELADLDKQVAPKTQTTGNFLEWR